MVRCVLLISLLPVLTAGAAESYVVVNKCPPQYTVVNNTPAPAVPLYAYEEGVAEAKKTGKPMIVWVGFPFPSTLDSCINVSDTGVVKPKWWPAKGAVVSVWVDNTHAGLPVSLTDSNKLTVADARRMVREIKQGLEVRSTKPRQDNCPTGTCPTGFPVSR